MLWGSQVSQSFGGDGQYIHLSILGIIDGGLPETPANTSFHMASELRMTDIFKQLNQNSLTCESYMFLLAVYGCWFCLTVNNWT